VIPEARRTPDKHAAQTRCWLELAPEGAQLKVQIPWLRVFVEGLVIVGKLEEAASTGGSSRSDREYSDSLRP